MAYVNKRRPTHLRCIGLILAWLFAFLLSGVLSGSLNSCGFRSNFCNGLFNYSFGYGLFNYGGVNSCSVSGFLVTTAGYHGYAEKNSDSENYFLHFPKI